MVIRIFSLKKGCLKKQPFLFMPKVIFIPVSKTFD